MRRSYKYRRRRSSGIGCFGVLFLLVVLIVGAVAAIIYSPGTLGAKFNRFERFNLVVSSPSVRVISVDTSGRDLVEIDFPDDWYIGSVAHGYGQYKISKIYEVGQLDKRGGAVLSDTMANYLGLSVDGYVRRPRSGAFNYKSFFLRPDFFLSDASNLNLLDKISFARAVLSVRFDRVKKIDLGKTGEKLVLADGSEALGLDPDVVDNLLSGLFMERGIVNENLRVTVTNSTSLTGLANGAARILTNLGVRVVGIDTDSSLVTNCQINGKKEVEKSATLRRISEVFNCKTNLSESFPQRGDIQVILGQDFSDRLTK